MNIENCDLETKTFLNDLFNEKNQRETNETRTSMPKLVDYGSDVSDEDEEEDSLGIILQVETKPQGQKCVNKLDRIYKIIGELNKEACALESQTDELEMAIDGHYFDGNDSAPLLDCEEPLQNESSNVPPVDLPLHSKNLIDEFEKNLQIPEYKALVIQHLKLLYGSGEIPEKKEVARTIINKLIKPELLAGFTWTGKAKGTKKNAFRSYTGIIDVMFKIIHERDESFTLEKLTKIITYDILKYAYKFEEK